VPYDGFYWHVRQAEPSGLTLRKFGKGDPQVAIDTAVAKAWEAIRGVRSGSFGPQSPEDGCPRYCPAAEFCERYQRTYWG